MSNKAEMATTKIIEIAKSTASGAFVSDICNALTELIAKYPRQAAESATTAILLFTFS